MWWTQSASLPSGCNMVHVSSKMGGGRFLPLHPVPMALPTTKNRTSTLGHCSHLQYHSNISLEVFKIASTIQQLEYIFLPAKVVYFRLLLT